MAHLGKESGMRAVVQRYFDKLDSDNQGRELSQQEYENIRDEALDKTYGKGYSMILEPFSEEDENILRNCRDELSKLLKIKFENHQKYTFHITLAYILRKLTQEEINNLLKVNKNLLDEFVKKIPKIVLKDPTVCTFENMLEFKSINSSNQ